MPRVASRNATTIRCGNRTASSSTTAATLPAPRTRPAAHTSIVVRRFHRSTSAPAGSWATRFGSSVAKVTRLAAVADPVDQKTSSV